MKFFRRLLLTFLLPTALAFAAGGPCPRFAPGSAIASPPDLYSQGAALTVHLTYNTASDAAGRTLYCFTTSDGAQSPTLHVHPGDRMIVQVKNNLPKPAQAMDMQMSTNASLVCGAKMMDASSVNLHYHGTNISPACHSDDVIHTLIKSGDTFNYELAFPADEPPGLYWYHPHVHGLSEAAVQGGASGAIVVEGIENVQPAIAGLPQRLLVVRDQVLAGVAEDDPNAPAWDLSLNYVPIEYPKMTPAVIRAPAGQREFWRVLNAAADAILDVEVLYDDAPQTLGVVAIDGVSVGSQNGGPAAPPIGVTHFRMPPASRVEFLVTTPGASVRAAVLRTRAVNTGPDGDADPQRVIAKIVAGGAETAAMAVKSLEPTAMQSRQRFQALAETQPAAARRLYFSEDDDSFFITVDGQTPQAFSADAPPAITTTQGTTEDWIIENRTKENHEFHIHQIHFLVLEQTNFEVNGSEAAKILQGQMADMIDIPFWDGNPAHPYPAVKLRMDFRGPDIGDFVYHCHILEHEDGGMMATVRVESGKSGNGTKPAVQHR